MIRFFKKNRQNLFLSNKIEKYSKYAFGEIILLMIGILFALQVDSLQNKYELEKEELKILHSIQNEFSKNTVEYDRIYQKHLNRKKSIEIIVGSKITSLSIDSLLALQNRGDNHTFELSKSIYNSIINFGKTNLYVITSQTI